ncbi:hypothetical protein L7F22_056044 [Adiantum nelumboides]|nr:hypothetical protein [Adiantum nelumboides]
MACGLYLYFMGKPPSEDEFRRWFTELYGDKVTLQKFHFAGRGFYQALVESNLQREYVLAIVAAFKGNLVFTVPWSPALQPEDMLLHHCPVWIELPNLPYYLWDQVKEVAGTLGKVLYTPNECQGLCSLARQMYVKKLIQSEKLDIVMLQETKIGALSLQVKGYACITSKADRGSGGCMTLISNAYKVKEVLQPDCGRWIACQVCIQNEWIGVINVYAPNCPQERKLMWGQLSQIDWDVPLLFAGDWNCEDAELQSNEWIAWKNKFDAVDVVSLQGCDALAYPTWTNRHMKSGFVARRLDRIYLSDKGSKCTRAAATQSPNDPIVLHLLQVFESTAKDLETQKAEAARVQTNLYWLKTGDAPNKTFFKALRAKKDSELITALRKPDGGVTEDETEIKQMFKDSLFGIVGSPMTWNEQLQQKLNTFLEPMDSKINEGKKLLLGRPFSVYEVETVVKAMKKEKTPSPDGIQAEVVHPKQFGFVQGRSIHEAILNVITAIDWAAEQEDEYVMINMDLEKAYDRVSWEYILAVIDRMGFGSLFLGMVKTLFQNASASIQVNGYISNSFQLVRSIRQKCPLAPLLFAMATDPLLMNLDLQLQRQAIKPLPLPQGQSFLAQLFADDNYNIVKCEHSSIAALMEVYGDSCDVSGSRIAPHKTECLRLTYKEDTGVLNSFGLVDAGIGTIISKLDSEEPWACIMREKIRDAKLLGHKWSNTNWEDKLFCPVKIKIQNSPALQNITRSWKYKLKNAQWKTGQRFDSSLNQSIWLCMDAMKNCQAAALLNPQLTKTLEKKGYAVFKNIWDVASQDWGIDQRRWRTLKPREKVFLSQVIQGIKEDWPTSFLVATQPSISNWDLKECRRSVPTQSWIRNMVTGWAKEGCFFTSEVCRKTLKQAWKSTSSGRYNLLLWRITARKIPVRALCSRWGKSSPYCPICHSCRETVKHTFWDCRCISPVWRSCSKLLESYGVTEKITWKQAILGIKGRMNPAMFDIWHFIRASILSRIWYDRNLIAHKKPAMSIDPTQVKVAMVEGCLLAKARPKIRAQASILLKKLRKDPGRHQEMQEVVGLMKNLSVHMMGGGRSQVYGYGRGYGSNEGFVGGRGRGMAGRGDMFQCYNSGEAGSSGLTAEEKGKTKVVSFA